MKTITFRTLMIIMLAFMSTMTYTQCQRELSAELLEKEILSEKEIESLIKMREEEMLAHDVYLAFSELYPIPVFRNIANSETRHTEAVKGLLDKYGLEDPALAHETGVFTDPHFQELYTQLVERGRKSVGEAVKVGLLIEDMDIADLEEALAGEVDNADIIFVYENLLRGSKNHMKAFYAHASVRGLTYDPVYISESQYLEITGVE